MLDDTAATDFQETVWNYYHDHGRHDLPWRLPEASGRFDTYKIMLSEVMLQQTQAGRVIPKYQEFLHAFPTVTALAAADLGNVLRVWSGLGYNRRAKFLHQATKRILEEYGGVVPEEAALLTALPGIGPNTAGAILAYAFNRPVAFIETNIRTVFIHCFFEDRTNVPDTQVRDLVERTLDSEHPREWYWALMDYGNHLKRTTGNASRQSRHYSVQSAFQGSRRQVRGQVLRLLQAGSLSLAQLRKIVDDERLPSILEDLVAEQMISRKSGRYCL